MKRYILHTKLYGCAALMLVSILVPLKVLAVYVDYGFYSENDILFYDPNALPATDSYDPGLGESDPTVTENLTFVNSSEGLTVNCEDGGKEVTVKAGPYPVTKRLLTNQDARRHGCIIPKRIVIHWSAGPSNNSTYYTFNGGPNGIACQTGVDRNGSVEQWQQLWEKKIEKAWCVGGNWNADSINIEMVGAYFDGDTFSWYGPPPAAELSSAVELTCWMMGQYNITVENIFGHYEAPYGKSHGKSDPGKIFLHTTFIPKIKKTCPGAGA